MPYIPIPSVHPSVGRSHGWAESGVVRFVIDGTISRVQKQISEVSAKMADKFIQHNSILRSAFVAKVAARLASLSPNNKSFSTADSNNASRWSWLIVDLSFDFTRASLEKLRSTEAVVTGSVNRTFIKNVYEGTFSVMPCTHPIVYCQELSIDEPGAIGWLQYFNK